MGADGVRQVFATDDSVYAATTSGLSVSAVTPVSFTNYTTSNGLGSDQLLSIFVKDDTIYAGTDGYGLSISPVHPVTFTTTASGAPFSPPNVIRDVFATDDTVYTATEGGLGISTDGGATFTYRTTTNGLGNVGLLSVFATDDTIYAATRGGLSISTDGGASFVNRTIANGLGDDFVSDVMVINDTVYAATNGGLSISTDGGASFTTYIATGFAYVSHLFATASNIYLSGENVGLGITSNPPSSTPASTPSISGVSPATGPTTGGTSVTITGSSLTGATSVTFAGVPATVTSNTSSQIVATTPAGTAGAVAVAVTTGGGTATSASAFTYTSPTPPGPTPPATFPPTAPLSVGGVAGDGSALVSWTASADAGSFPVTNYQAMVSPGGQTCLVASPALTCTVTGLTNGTAYTATLRALNGAGWGPYSAASASFTPQPSVTPSITITGTRAEVRGKPGVVVTGTTTGFGMEAILRPWIRFPGQTSYTQGTASILVDVQGGFTWERRTGKTIYISIRSEDGTVESNRLVVRTT